MSRDRPTDALSVTGDELELLLAIIDTPWLNRASHGRHSVGGARQLAVAVTLWRHGERPITHKAIADRLDCSDITVLRAIDAMVSAGVLIRTRHGGANKPASYRFDLDALIGRGAAARAPAG